MVGVAGLMVIGVVCVVSCGGFNSVVLIVYIAVVCIVVVGLYIL